MDEDAVLDSVEPIRRLVVEQAVGRVVKVRNAAGTGKISRSRALLTKGVEGGGNLASAAGAVLDAGLVLHADLDKGGLAGGQTFDAAGDNSVQRSRVDRHFQAMALGDELVLVRVLDKDLNNLDIVAAFEPLGGEVGGLDTDSRCLTCGSC